jgi:DNA-binding MarR family transcriptional regulator
MGQLLGDVKDALIDDLHERLHAAGFTDIRPAHGCVFRFIPPEGMRLSDLAAAARMTKQSVGEHVFELEQLDYIERVPDPADGRAKLIRPTKKGLASMQVARQAFAEIEAGWAQAVGERRVAELRSALEAVRALYAPN